MVQFAALWCTGCFERLTHTQTTPSHWITSVYAATSFCTICRTQVWSSQQADSDGPTGALSRSRLRQNTVDLVNQKREIYLYSRQWQQLHGDVKSFALELWTKCHLLHLTGQMQDKNKAMNFWPVIQTAEEALQLGGNQSPPSTPSLLPSVSHPPSHKPPLKTSCSPFYGCQMVGRPPCLWTCLSSLVKPVDLSNIKTAIYEKAWNKTHKHPATETIKRNLISQRALLRDRSRTAETPWKCTPAPGWWSPDAATPRYAFSVKGFYLRALGVSAGLWQRLNFSLRNREAKQTELSAFRSELNHRTAVWPVVQTFCSSTDFTLNKHSQHRPPTTKCTFELH